MISASRDKTIRRWDLREGKEIKEAREVYENDIRAVGVSRDGRWVVTAVGGVLKVHEVETGITRIFHEDLRVWIKCIDISADSTLVAGGSIDGRALVWSLDTGKVVAGPLKCSDGYVCALRLLDDSKSLAVMSNWGKRLQVWDVQAQKLDVSREESAANNGLPLPVCWTTKKKSIITVFSFTSDDTATTNYELDALTLKAFGDSFKGHTKIITGLALSAGYVLLASASDDDTIKHWSFESRQLFASFDVHVPYSIVLSPDSCQLAYTTQKETKIYVCNIPANILASIDLAKEVRIHPFIIRRVLRYLADDQRPC
jgi:WD40 repeat protein